MFIFTISKSIFFSLNHQFIAHQFKYETYGRIRARNEKKGIMQFEAQKSPAFPLQPPFQDWLHGYSYGSVKPMRTCFLVYYTYLSVRFIWNLEWTKELRNETVQHRWLSLQTFSLVHQSRKELPLQADILPSLVLLRASSLWNEVLDKIANAHTLSALLAHFIKRILDSTPH